MRAQRDDETRAVLAELPVAEWDALARLADADDRTISQMATRLLRRALRETLAAERLKPQPEAGDEAGAVA